MEFRETPDLIRWRESVARGSHNTASVYFRRLRRFCIQNNIQPEDLIKKDVKDIQNLLDDNITRLEKEGKLGSYISGIVKAVKSWLAHNDIKLNRRLKIKNVSHTPTLDDERVPTQEELKSIINQATTRGKATISLISQSGIRFQVMGEGTDGLRIKDLRELEVKDGKPSFKKTPAMITVRQSLSKTDSKYVTFLSSEGCEYVLAHLQERINLGEKLDLESPLIGYGDRGAKNIFRNSDEPFTSVGTVTKEVRKAIGKAGFKWRPYVLRGYFASMLHNAESKGKITHSNAQFFMGHKGEMLARYTTNKGRLPEDMIEGMRTAYRDSENYLMTTPRQEGMMDDQKKNMLNIMNKTMSSIFPGINFEVKVKEVESREEKPLTADQVFETNMNLVSEHVKKDKKENDARIKNLENLIATQNPENPDQKIIHEKDFDSYKEDGWAFKSPVNTHNICIERRKTNTSTYVHYRKKG